VEIGLGLRQIALAHVVGHACVRTLQLLRAPSALEDWLAMERWRRGRPQRTGAYLEQILPQALRRRLYHVALERGHHDALLERLVIAPVLRLAAAADRLERALVGEGRVARPPRATKGVGESS
jgi:hypothetical protein